MNKNAILLVASYSLMSSGCIEPGCNEGLWGYIFGEFNSYQVQADQVTPDGISYDSSGLPIAPELIDRLTREVETCLQASFPDSYIPYEISSVAGCRHQDLELPIDRSSFEVKVVSDWVLSCDQSQQMLPTEAGGEGCIEKGLIPTQECPCHYRAGIACPNKLIVTPSFYLYKDVLTRYITSCVNPWAHPALSSCASPSTLPLSNGSKL